MIAEKILREKCDHCGILKEKQFVYHFLLMSKNIVLCEKCKKDLAVLASAEFEKEAFCVGGEVYV